MATKYYGFGGYLDNDEPLGLMRMFDGNRTPETLHQQKGWLPQDHLRTYVNSGEAWEISEEAAAKIALKRGHRI